jgi:hypothetical protein
MGTLFKDNFWELAVLKLPKMAFFKPCFFGADGIISKIPHGNSKIIFV